MSNVMSLKHLRNNTSRNGFDLSQKNAFTAKVGELLPVMTKECLPGDKFKINMQWFTRTQPVCTSAYTRIREYYDVFFVPTNLLWNKFNTFVTSMTNNNQVAKSISDNAAVCDMHPYFTTNQVAKYLTDIDSPSNSSRNGQFGYHRCLLSQKLLEYLGYGVLNREKKTSDSDYYVYSSPYNVNLNPFPLLAYQKIYSDYFRNSQWENSYAPAFNINYVDGSSASLNLPISAANLGSHNNMFDLRYCNYNKDYFMGLLPSAQYGQPASVNLGSSTFSVSSGPTNEWITCLNALKYTTDSESLVRTSTSGVIYNPTGSTYNDSFVINKDDVSRLRDSLSLSGTANLQTAFSILALRQAEAKQKWEEITQSQNQDYKSQLDAHFGVKVSDAYSERCRYVGGTSNNLDISEVVNTNLADDNAPNVNGKGIGVGNGNIEFECQTHGYLMCIYHAVPLLDYQISGISRTNLKTTVTDYAIPEFDKTGMVSVNALELSNRFSYNLGYAPRYVDYKTSYDVVNGAFRGSMSDWVAPIDDNYISQYLQKYGGGLNSGFMKVRPNVLDSIFGVQADSTVDTDQLLINSAFDIKAVRNLDYNGLPY